MTDDKRTARADARAALKQQLAESRAKAAAVPRPATVNYALYVGVTQIVLMLVYAALSFGFTDGLHKLIRDATGKSINDVTFTAKGTPPTGDAVTGTKPSASTVAKPAIAISTAITTSGKKFGDKDLVTDQKVDFAYTVTNTGSVALKDVTVDRGKTSGGGDWTDVACELKSLEPGASTVCTQSFMLKASDLSDSLSRFRTQTLMSVGLFTLMIIVIGGMIRRGSGGARWGYIALNIIGAFVSFPAAALYITQFTSDWPKPMGVIQSLAALAGLVAIVLLMLPRSAEYFRTARAASGKPSMFGGGAAARGAAGGRRGGLFGPRPTAAPAPSTPAAGDDSVSLTKQSKSKTRADASAAKGAELARARAKASKAKSRKTADR